MSAVYQSLYEFDLVEHRTIAMILAVLAMFLLIIFLLQSEQNKARLISNERLFRALIEKSSDAVALINDKAEILYSSPSTKKVMGYTAEQLLGKNGFSVVHSEDVSKVKEILGDLRSQFGKSKTFHVRAKRRDGVWIWVEGVVTNLLHDPIVRAIVVNYRDISKTKVAEQQLKKFTLELGSEKAKVEALLAGIGDGLVAVDNESRIIMVNEAFEKLLGWKRGDVMTRKTMEVINIVDEEGKEVPEAARPLNESMQTGKTVSGTHYLVRKNGSKFPATVTASPVVLNNKIIGAVKVFHDVSQEKQIDRAKSEFVSLASHQLRTPLTVVKWYTKYLVENASKVTRPKLKEYLGVILQTNNSMVELVNAILNASKIDLGKLAIEPEQTFLPAIMDQALNEYSPLIKQKKLRIEKQYSGDVPKIQLDPKLMKVVFANIISNAVKYTDLGGNVIVQMRKDKQNVVIAVSDNGCGIPHRQKDGIFTKLFRADNAIEKDSTGTGLGLYIVKSVIDQSGGKIWFTSPAKPLPNRLDVASETSIEELAHGKQYSGTTFYISLPVTGVQPRTGSKNLSVT